VGFDKRKDEGVDVQAMAVARFSIGGCIVFVIGLVARHVGVKHRMPMRV